MQELYKLIMDYIPENEQEKNDKKIMLKYIKKFDDVLTRQNEVFHLSTSAWIVNHDKTKVLMIYHNIYDSWAWIGGHADGNSNLLEAIKKEISEETGVKNVNLLIDGIFGLSIHYVKPHIKNGKYVNAHLHFDIQFLFEASENDILKIKQDENSDVRWLDIDSVLDMVTDEYMKSIYEKLMNKVKKLFK